MFSSFGALLAVMIAVALAATVLSTRNQASALASTHVAYLRAAFLTLPHDARGVPDARSLLALREDLHALRPKMAFEMIVDGATLGGQAPDDEEVESLLRTVARRVVRLLERLGRLDEDAFPQDALQALQAASIQRRLPFPRDAESPPPRKRRCASLSKASPCTPTPTPTPMTGTTWKGSAATGRVAPSRSSGSPGAMTAAWPTG